MNEHGSVKCRCVSSEPSPPKFFRPSMKHLRMMNEHGSVKCRCVPSEPSPPNTEIDALRMDFELRAFREKREFYVHGTVHPLCKTTLATHDSTATT